MLDVMQVGYCSIVSENTFEKQVTVLCSLCFLYHLFRYLDEQDVLSLTKVVKE